MSVGSGIVFDIQHYAVHDGPGIRTLVFLKGCPLRCAWCCNPESQAPRPVLRKFQERCRACLRCADVCPHGAVRLTEGVVVVDRARCAACDAMPCVPACPSQALAVSGQTMSVEAVVSRVAADRGFYRNSGGGVTFSGGEPLAQRAFLMALLAACRAEGIHTAVETCGQVDPAALREAEPLVDLFLFDLKGADADRHRRLTGHDNGAILENLALLAALCRDKVVVRLPLVPGLTDDEPSLGAIAAFTGRLGLTTVQVVPYHPLGRDKYREVGLPDPPEVPPLDPAVVNRALAILTAHGLAAEVA